jgi:hypothetical protein
MAELEISPNPSNGQVCVRFPGDPDNWVVSIFSLQGIPLRRIEVNNDNELKLDLRNSFPGTYICRAVCPGKAMYSIKLEIVK